MELKTHDSMGRPVKHGLHNSPEHNAWRKMKDRCLNPKSQRWDRYGGRGITVCDSWKKSFIAFYNDMGPRPTPDHSLERLDNDGHYTPSNCEWALRIQQANNTSSNRIIEFDGCVKTLSEWSRDRGIGKKTLSCRLEAGWSIKDALTLPVEHRTWLTNENAVEIHKLHKKGWSPKCIAQRFGVSRGTVYQVLNGRSFSRIHSELKGATEGS